MPQIPKFLFDFRSRKENDEDTPMNEVDPLNRAVVEDRSAQQGEETDALEHAARAVHYASRPLARELQRSGASSDPLGVKQTSMEVNAPPAMPAIPTHMDVQPPDTQSPLASIPQLSPIAPPNASEPQLNLPIPVVFQSNSVSETTRSHPQTPASLSQDLRPMIQKRPADSNTSQRVITRKNANTRLPRTQSRETVTDKARLVEQLDLTTRKIIEEKDDQIAKLQAKVDDYKTKWDAIAAQIEELEKRASDERRDLENHLSQVDIQSATRSSNDHTELVQALLMFEGQDINMMRKPNIELHQTPLFVESEDVNMAQKPEAELDPTSQTVEDEDTNMGQKSNEELGRASQTVEGDDADTGMQMEEGHAEVRRENDSEEAMITEDEEIHDSRDGDEDIEDEDSEDQGEGMRNRSQSSVPKPIHHFQRPRGGAGPRLRIDPQIHYAADPVSNPIQNDALQSLNMMREQIAAITQIVMSVQSQNASKPAASSSKRKKNASGIIVQQIERDTDPRRNVLVTAVRKHMNSLLDIKSDKEIRWASQPSKEAVDAFAEREGPGPTLVPLALYFAYKKKHAWNLDVGEKFFDDFCEQEGPKLNLEEKEWPIIYEIFWQRFSNLKREWKKWQLKVGEDTTAVSHRNFETGRITLKGKRRNARRKHLKQLRVAITDGNRVKPDGTKDDVWYFLWQVATELGTGGMSSDESSAETGRKYVIKSVPWRSDEIIPYLQMIDNDFNRYNRYGTYKPGNPFRDRVRLAGATASARPAIRGLPINFYDKTWYANLTSEARAFLQEKPQLPFPVIVTYNN